MICRNGTGYELPPESAKLNYLQHDGKGQEDWDMDEDLDSDSDSDRDLVYESDHRSE
jgi:hypothetical protein